MNNIIPLNSKRYLPHELKTRENAVITYRNCGDSGYVCRKYHISRTSLWRWDKKYDGTLEKLVEELLARRRYVYQIFRFKTYSGGYRLHAVYELPIERDDILQQQEIRCCLTQVRDDMQKCA